MTRHILLATLLASPSWAAQAGAELYQFDGTQIGEVFGNSVASAGDVNADGYDDVLVGSIRYLHANGNAIGSVWVYSGADGSLIHHLTRATNDLAFFGFAVDGMGDLNGDGYDDFVASSPGETLFGTGYFISGFDGSTLHRFEFTGPVDVGRDAANAGDVNGDGINDAVFGSSSVSNTTGTVVVVSGADGSQIYQLIGEVGREFGSAVGGAGDVNQDGFDDFVVAVREGAIGSGITANGEVRVYSGQDASVLYSWFGADHEYMGNDVAGAGDVNGDGHDDVLVCSSRADAGADRSGRVTLYSGLNGSVIYEWTGRNRDDQFGTAADSAGDVNNDGVPDIDIGMRYAEPQGLRFSGRAFVMSGADGSMLANWKAPNAGMSLGSNVAGAGDVNGDGFDDILIAADRNEVGGLPAVGSVFVQSGGWAGVPELNLVTVAAGKRLLGAIRGGTTNGTAIVAWSMAGPGPTATPFGDALVSIPFVSRRVELSPSGVGLFFADRLPIMSIGMPIWFHGVDIESGIPLLPIATTVN